MRIKISVLMLSFFVLACGSNSNSGGGGAPGGRGPSGVTSRGSEYFAIQETFEDPAVLEQKGYACGMTRFEHKIDARLRVGTSYEEAYTLGSVASSSRQTSSKTVTSVLPQKLVYEGVNLIGDAGSKPQKFRETHTCVMQNGENQCRSERENLPFAQMLQLQNLLADFQAPIAAAEDCELKNVVSTQKFFGGQAKVAGAPLKGARFELTSTFTYVCNDGTSKPGSTSIAVIATQQIASANPASCNQVVYLWLEQIIGDQSSTLEYQLTGHKP
jgi:hypothetical protein